MTDAVVVGSGPNGLAAAIELARAGLEVVVVEGADRPGGGMRSAELTRPGFVHDVCSTVHALALASPFFRSVPVTDLGVEFAHPEIPFAHPLDSGEAVFLHRSIERTAQELGSDGKAYRRLMEPLARDVEVLMDQFLGPLRIPRHPLAAARFALTGIRSAEGLARARFSSVAARALIAGAAAHSMLPLSNRLTAGFGLVLSLLAHAVGWPVVAGGSTNLAGALVTHLESLGGRVETGRWVGSISDLPTARCYLFDVTPRQLLAIAGDDLPARYRSRLARYRYGTGIFKVDWALDEPIPWKASDVRRAGTVHVCGSLEEIAAAESQANRGIVAERPFVLLVQPTACDPSRAPSGKHTAWAYCHVPAGAPIDMTDAMEMQIERFAPGFRDVIIGRHTMSAPEVEAYNPNYVGGDINGGVQDVRQLFSRPVARLDPYGTPNPKIFLCSSSTPPGGGVHGMCGSFAARAALRRLGRD